jgi:hypothetical protein
MSSRAGGWRNGCCRKREAMIIIEDLEAAAAEDAMQRIGDILGAFNDAATGLRDRGRPLALVLAARLRAG